MRLLYLASVWLHIMAAIAWVGGMLFLVLVVVPWLRREGRATGPAMLRDTGRRFRAVGWWCFVILLVTGSLNLWVRGVRLSTLADPGFYGTAFGHTVALKLGLFLLVLLVSAVHDFRVGPRATEALQRDPTGSAAQRLRRQASLLGRANAALGLALVAVAVTLVRGCP